MIKSQVRRANADDWESLRAIRLRSLVDSPDAFATTLAQDESRTDDEWRERAGNASVAQFLATAGNGELLGIAVGTPFSDYEDGVSLCAMWIAPEARGNRIGRSLAEAVLNWARDSGFRRVILDVADANVAAIALYDAIGFVPTGKTSSLPPPRQHIANHERCMILS